jgi:O-antigen ligase
LITALSLGLLFNAVAGLFQTINWIMINGLVLVSDGEWFRVKGLCGSPADYVMQLITGLFLTSFIDKAFYRNTLKFIYIFLLVLSMSRSAIVVILMLILLYLFNSKFKINMINVMKTIFASIILGIIVYLLDADFIIYQRIMDIGSGDLNNRRLVVIDDALSKSFSNYLTTLIGNGYGSYLFYNPYADEYFTNIHNIYIHILYSSGMFGMISFLLLLIYIISNMIYIKEHIVRFYNRKFFYLSNNLIIFYVSVLLIGLVETNITSVSTGWLVGIIFGIPVVISRIIKTTNYVSN